jgi:hypothetical protein
LLLRNVPALCVAAGLAADAQVFKVLRTAALGVVLARAVGWYKLQAWCPLIHVEASPHGVSFLSGCLVHDECKLEHLGVALFSLSRVDGCITTLRL